MQLRGGQNEHQMLRRLLQNFKQGVEGRRGEHVHLVDDVHALFQHRGGIHRLLPKGTDVIHAVVAGGVQLSDVQKPAFVDASAGLALIAGGAVHGGKAVDGLGQNAGAGGLARAAGAGEEVGVAGASLRHLPLQRVGDVPLAYHLGKGSRPPLAVERLIHEPASFNKSIADFASADAKIDSPPHEAAEPAPLRHMDDPS